MLFFLGIRYGTTHLKVDGQDIRFSLVDVLDSNFSEWYANLDRDKLIYPGMMGGIHFVDVGRNDCLENVKSSVEELIKKSEVPNIPIIVIGDRSVNEANARLVKNYLTRFNNVHFMDISNLNIFHVLAKLYLERIRHTNPYHEGNRTGSLESLF